MDNAAPEPSPTSDETILAEADARPAGVFPPPRKLTDEQERELTRLYAETRTPLADIARRFSVSEVSVSRIAQRNGAARRRRGPGRGRAPETTPAEPGGNGRRRQRRAAGAEPGATRRRRAAPASDVPAAFHGASLPVAAVLEPAPQAAGNGAHRRFRIRFFAERVVDAEDMRSAISQAEALGATDITGIAQEES